MPRGITRTVPRRDRVRLLTDPHRPLPTEHDDLLVVLPVEVRFDSLRDPQVMHARRPVPADLHGRDVRARLGGGRAASLVDEGARPFSLGGSKANRDPRGESRHDRGDESRAAKDGLEPLSHRDPPG